MSNRRVIAICCFVCAFTAMGVAGTGGAYAMWTEDLRLLAKFGLFIPVGAILARLGGWARDW